MQALQALPLGASGIGAALACTNLPGTISAALTAYSGASRGCCNHHWLPPAAAAADGASRDGVSNVQAAAPHAAAASASRSHHGNVYPPLTAQQLEAMRARRLAANCDPASLLARPAADAHEHQTKHILVCSGASCRAACGTCGGGASQAAVGERAWEYLAKRLKEVNQLRAEDDETPILFSRIDCSRAQSLLPALASTEPCHGPIAVVLPEAVFYERLSPLVLERIIEEHLLGGRVVTSHVMMGSRHAGRVTPALDITRRANPTGYFACHYAW